jgi:hypothetical protein
MFGVTVVRLYPRRLPDGTAPLGLSCDEEGVLLGGGMPLVFREQDAAGKATYRERHVAEINFALSAAYGDQVDFGSRMELLRKIAEHLTVGNLAAARIAALHLRVPELPDAAAVNRLDKAERLLAGYLSPSSRTILEDSGDCPCARTQSARARGHKRDVSNEPRSGGWRPVDNRWRCKTRHSDAHF